MKIVLDSNVLVRAFLNKSGLSGEILAAILAKGHGLIVSNDLLQEVTRVLRYPRFLHSHQQSEESIYEFAEELRKSATTIPLGPYMTSPIRDPADVIIVETAVIGKADAICTLDRDFYSPPASTFLASYGIEVMTDVQLMNRIRQ